MAIGYSGLGVRSVGRFLGNLHPIHGISLLVVEPTHLKNSSQIGSSPQVGANEKSEAIIILIPFRHRLAAMKGIKTNHTTWWEVCAAIKGD